MMKIIPFFILEFLCSASGWKSSLGKREKFFRTRAPALASIAALWASNASACWRSEKNSHVSLKRIFFDVLAYYLVFFFFGSGGFGLASLDWDIFLYCFEVYCFSLVFAYYLIVLHDDCSSYYCVGWPAYYLHSVEWGVAALRGNPFIGYRHFFFEIDYSKIGVVAHLNSALIFRIEKSSWVFSY